MPPLDAGGLCRFMLVAFLALLFARPAIPRLLGYGLTISRPVLPFVLRHRPGMPKWAGVAGAAGASLLPSFLAPSLFMNAYRAQLAIATSSACWCWWREPRRLAVPPVGLMLTLAAALSWACGNIFNKIMS